MGHYRNRADKKREDEERGAKDRKPDGVRGGEKQMKDGQFQGRGVLFENRLCH